LQLLKGNNKGGDLNAYEEEKKKEKKVK